MRQHPGKVLSVRRNSLHGRSQRCTIRYGPIVPILEVCVEYKRSAISLNWCAATSWRELAEPCSCMQAAYPKRPVCISACWHDRRNMLANLIKAIGKQWQCCRWSDRMFRHSSNHSIVRIHGLECVHHPNVEG